MLGGLYQLFGLDQLTKCLLWFLIAVNQHKMLTIICIVVTLLVKGVGDHYTFLHVMQVNALLYDK